MTCCDKKTEGSFDDSFFTNFFFKEKVRTGFFVILREKAKNNFMLFLFLKLKFLIRFKFWLQVLIYYIQKKSIRC